MLRNILIIAICCSSSDIIESSLALECRDMDGQVEQRLQFPSLLNIVPVKCAKCGRLYRSTGNNKHACFWHMGVGNCTCMDYVQVIVIHVSYI